MLFLRNILLLGAAALVALSIAAGAFGAAQRSSGCSVVTAAATAITQNSATLHGHLSCGSGTMTYKYGATTAYGSTASVTSPASGTADQPVTITGLAPGRTYHFAFDVSGITGTDFSFTTLGSPSDESADLAITQSVIPGSVGAGGSVTYTLVATNVAGATALGVTVRDALPAGLAFVSASTTKGSCTKEVSCSIGSLDKGESATVTIVATANVAGSIVNVAEVGATNPDPNVGANNRASTTVTVTAPAAATTTAGTTTTSATSDKRRTVATRSITAKPGVGWIAAFLQSSELACVKNALVRLERAGSQTSITSKVANGGVIDFKSPGPGRYVVVVHRHFVGNIDCPAASSSIVTMR